MHIEEIVIDGFKSYASRTVVSGFDPAFNAITGLNGSGKSNILDSICFVLGISNLSQVRAGNLQELVYKQGQAGVTKATVSIVFNNSDRSSSPVGYEDVPQITVTRQIVIGGRNKYLINGHVAQPSRVQNLFHSVQLNVNNPHFLIMQGRITKVINMKPPEVLAMIEEAAGTRMYEMKKDTALKTIDKKQRKVEEIDTLLREKITPSLEKLKSERATYVKYNKNKDEMESLERFLIAYRYYHASNVVSTARTKSSALQERISNLKADSFRLKTSIKELDGNMAKLIEKIELEKQSGLKAFETSLDYVGKDIVKLTSLLENKNESLQAEEDKLNELHTSITESNKALQTLSAKHQKSCESVQEALKYYEQCTSEVDAAQKAILTGASSKGGASQSMSSSAVDQLESARRTISAMKTEIDQLTMRKKHLTEEYQRKYALLNKDKSNVEKIKDQKSKATQAIQIAKVALLELDYDRSGVEKLQEDKIQQDEKLSKLREELDALSSQLSALDFTYSSPEPNFNDSKVKGLVANLIKVSNIRNATAVEVTAGGRLFQVVVDSEMTGKQLLEKGKLKKRVTIIPLNKINRGTLSDDIIKGAKKIESTSDLALNLIGYDQEVEAAMEYVFGRTIVCPDMNSAKSITFNPALRCRTVTLEGDVFDPAGTLTGGANTKSHSSILIQLGKLHDLREQVNLEEKRMMKIVRELTTASQNESKYIQLKQNLELQEHEAKLLDEKLTQSATGNLMEEVDRISKELTEIIPEGLKKAHSLLEENTVLAKNLEESLSNADNAREQAMKDADQFLAKCQQRQKQALQALSEAKGDVEKLPVQIESIKTEIEQLSSQAQATKAVIAELKEAIGEIEIETKEKKDAYDTIQEEMSAGKKDIVEKDKQLSRKAKEKDELEKDLEKCEIELSTTSNDLKNLNADEQNSFKLIEHLESEYVWIPSEKEYFGLPNSNYDFESRDIGKDQRKFEKLKSEHDKQFKHINAKAMMMFEKAEQEYKDLMSKKEIIEKDKEKIESVIRELDEKKNDTLKATWERVNRDFGSIFSTLLPGAKAKLEPPENGTVLEGLEIKVGFGDVWKQSLSELSGGQRSLIALSLILAMLLFKPAPMYILDEIDAALDLSHTENIGRMLKTHFSTSQFIVVSLKEGMFNNANVIFRTKFVDGISTVTKTTNRLGGAMGGNSENKENNNNNNGPKSMRVSGSVKN